MENNVLFAQDLVKCLAGIDFQVIDNNDKAFLEYMRETLGGSLLDLPAMQERAVMYRRLKPNCVYELRTDMGLLYLVFLDGKQNRLLLLGPSLMESYSEATVRQKLRKLSLSQQTIDSILRQCAKLPIVSINVLHQLCILLGHHLTGSSQNVSHRTVDLLIGFQEPEDVQPQDGIPHMRQVETRYEMSSAITEAVRQGNLSMALGLLSRYHPEVDNEIRNADPLRNFQNYCIVLNTQLRHALEESGIHPYRLDRLSHEIGLEIENLRSTDNAQDFVFLVIQRYCRLVQESAYPNLKPLIHLAVTYIKEHLNEDLTVKKTARILGVNANYLSAQFHESMGLTFIGFIHRERTKQAAALLKHTNLQIQQIASIVGYNNTSHFARQFQRFQGTSPRHYRQWGTL